MTAPTLFLGLDGASWPLLRDELDFSSLQNIQSLVSNGVDSVSESNLPPVTCPNWRCLSSGKTPGQLGVYWWERIDMDEETVKMVDADWFRTADIWDYLVEAELNVGVVNAPLNYPPAGKVHPFIAGGPDCESERFTSTPELERELREQFNYRVHTRTAPADPKDRVAEDILELIDLRFEVTKYLYQAYDLDFIFTVLYYLVRLEHYYWNDPVVQRVWEQIDEHLGWFIDQEFNIVAASDHGCTEIDTIFHINKWLASAGYLEVTSRSWTGVLASAGVNAENIATQLGRLGVRRRVSKSIPQRIINLLPASSGGTSGTNKTDLVDWDGTSALASGQGPVYLRSTIDRADLMDELLEVEEPTGDQILDTVHLAEDLYPEATEDTGAPDLIVEQRKGVHTTDDLGAGPPVQRASDRDKWRAENNKHGLFLAAGPDIRTNWSRELSDICDIMPSILHLFGIPIPRDISGDVLPLREDSTEVKLCDPLETGKGRDQPEETAIEERLQDLGYL